MLKPHNSLEEATYARHVIWMQSRKILKQCWEWCSVHSRAFIAIAIVSPRSRYAVVEMDLYGLGAGGLDVDPQAVELARLQRENERLCEGLRKAELIIDVQKEVAQMLGVPIEEHDLDGPS